MKAGAYQFDCSFGKKEKNLSKVASLVKDTDLELLVLPELFATGYQFRSKDEAAELSESVSSGQTVQLLSELSSEKNVYIVAGLAERDGDSLYNSAVLTGPEGLIGSYRKTHLFFEENLFFTPGDTGFKVWDTDIGKIGIMICFDWFYPESTRALALQGAEIIAHPANLVLPYCPDSMPVRALENRIFTVTANRVGTEDRKEGKPLKFIGQSLIVSPFGKVLSKASDDGEEVISADLDPLDARNKTLNRYNDILNDRRPDKYNKLCEE